MTVISGSKLIIHEFLKNGFIQKPIGRRFLKPSLDYLISLKDVLKSVLLTELVSSLVFVSVPVKKNLGHGNSQCIIYTENVQNVMGYK